MIIHITTQQNSIITFRLQREIDSNIKIIESTVLVNKYLESLQKIPTIESIQKHITKTISKWAKKEDVIIIGPSNFKIRFKSKTIPKHTYTFPATWRSNVVDIEVISSILRNNSILNVKGGKSNFFLDESTINGISYENFTEYPYYNTTITLSELTKRVKEIKSALPAIFSINHEKYYPRVLKQVCNCIDTYYLGKPTRFISDWNKTKRYDELTNFFTEKARNRCQIKHFRPPAENFMRYSSWLKKQSLRMGYKDNPIDFREFLFQALPSCHNFRPTMAAQFYSYFNAQSVIDFSAGWGDRLLAACAMDIKYVGIDPNQNLHPGYKEIINVLGMKTKQHVIDSGAEYLPTSVLEKVKSKLNIEQFDLLFTSPPFFDYELYDKRTQSINAHTVDSWIVYFLLLCVKVYSKHIKINGHVVLFIQDVKDFDFITPLVLLISLYSNDIHLEYKGIITSNNKFPYLIFKKKFDAVLNYRKQPITKSNIRNMLKKYYPKLLRYSENISDMHMFVNVKEKNNIIYDIGENGSLTRALKKYIMLNDKSLNKIIGYGTYTDSSVLKYTKIAQSMGLTFEFFTPKVFYDFKDEGNKTTWFNLNYGTQFKKALKEGMIQREIDVNSILMYNLQYLYDYIKRNKIEEKENALLLELDPLINHVSILTDTIREMMKYLKFDKYFDKTIYISVHFSSFLIAMYKAFPYAKFVVIITGFPPDDDNIQHFRTKVLKKGDAGNPKVQYNTLMKGDKKVLKSLGETELEPLNIRVYKYYKQHSSPGDLCWLFN